MNSFTINRIWLVLTIHGSLAYFHIPSYVEFQSPEDSNSFGYSIGYISNLNSLVVGDPLNGEDGKVYSCSITGLERKTSTCRNTEINITEYAGNYNKSGSPNQKFCLGASISVTPDYFLTCAPLWSSYTIIPSMFGALGTCFISNGTYVERYFGLTEKYYQKDKKTEIEDIYGGIGWNTLPDPQNNIILIAKPMLHSSISYIDLARPTSPAQVIKLDDGLNNFGYIGQGLAVGQFFDTKTLYAISMIHRTKTTGAVMFLYYDNTSKTLKTYLNDNNDTMLIEDSAVDSLYGVILHSVHLNFDNFTELLVGAPAQSITFGRYEQGAVHIYVGEATTAGKKSSNLCIYGTLDGSRFGTAVASTDLDGDGLSEIFISAPYEDKGVIYVLPGCEISSLLHKDRNSLVAVTSLKNIQRIVNSDTKSFGTSLLAMTDVDENGLNALAIGSLKSNKLLLYKSMPVINVTTTTVLDGEIIREQDINFTVTVYVHVAYTSKQKIINGKLFVKTFVDGDGATIANSKYEITVEENTFLNKVVVLFNHHDPGDYKFTAIVEADRENLKRPEYDKSLYIINPYSRVRDAIDVKRRCRGNDCVPKLSLKIEWTGGNEEYVLGSSEKENMTISVRNDGNDTYQSCARVRIHGAQFKIPDCVLEVDDWYRCDFTKIPRHGSYPVELQLDMTKRTSRDKNLQVDVSLFNNCAAFREESVKESKIITYCLNTTEVYVEGLNVDRNVTDSVIANDEIQDIDIHEVYVVINNGTVMWKSVRAVIEIKKETYIKNYTVTMYNTKHCSGENSESHLIINCVFDLNPNSVARFLTSINIIKKDIMDNFEDDKLSVTSNYTLYLKPTAETILQTLTTTLSYQVDGGFGNNKNLVIALSVFIGLFVLVVVVIVLFKVGFFKRAEKAKVDALKEEIRRESTRRRDPQQACAAKNDSSEDSAEECDIEVLEYDIPLHDINTQDTVDFVALIAEENL